MRIRSADRPVDNWHRHWTAGTLVQPSQWGQLSRLDYIRMSILIGLTAVPKEWHRDGNQAQSPPIESWSTARNLPRLPLALKAGMCPRGFDWWDLWSNWPPGYYSQLPRMSQMWIWWGPRQPYWGTSMPHNWHTGRKDPQSLSVKRRNSLRLARH